MSCYLSSFNESLGEIKPECWCFFRKAKMFSGYTWKRCYVKLNMDEGLLYFFKDRESSLQDTQKNKKSILYGPFNVRRCGFYDSEKSTNRPCTVKIECSSEVKSSPIYISFENIQVCDSFKSFLEELDGEFEGLDQKKKRHGGGFLGLGGSKKNKHNNSEVTEKRFWLEKNAVSVWKKEEVSAWLEIIIESEEAATELKESVENNFQKSKVALEGKTLLQMTEKRLKELSLFEGEYFDIFRRKFIYCVDLIRFRNGFFSLSDCIVGLKLLRFDHNLEKNLFGQIVHALSDDIQFKHHYLNTSDNLFMFSFDNNVESEEEEEEGEIEVEEIKKKKRRKIRDKDDDEQNYWKIQSFSPTKIRIKLIVLESFQTDLSTKKKKIESVLSPLIHCSYSQNKSHLPNLQSSPFRTGIVVGPWYFEWTDSELIIPKRNVSGRFLVISDVDSLYVQRKDLESLTQRISKFIVFWNTQYKYGEEKEQEGSKLKNCQEFFDGLFQVVLNTDEKILFGEDCGLKSFLNNMREKGKSKLEFEMSQKFIDFFGEKEDFEKIISKISKNVTEVEVEEKKKRIVNFETHQQLDEFCEFVQKNCFEIPEKFSSDWLLLRSFDRAFWWRHLLDTSNQLFKPLPPGKSNMDEFPTGCPFTDPRETKG